MRAVRSVLEQTFAAIQLIVVIDGPDLASQRALDTVQDIRLEYVVNPANVGLAEARNVGVRAADAAWIAFLDDDDLWLPSKIEKQFAMVAGSTSEKTLVVSRFFYRAPGRADAVLPENLPQPGKPLLESLFEPRGGGSHVSTFFCSRQLLLDIPFDKIAIVEDLDWMIRIGMQKDLRLLAINEPLSIYENHGTAANLLSKIDWKDFLAWGAGYRRILTRRAYTGFILFRCIPMARIQGKHWSALPVLLGQVLLFGRPTPPALLRFFAQYFVPSGLRRRVGNRIEMVRAYARRMA